MALNLVAKLGLNARGFVSGLAESQTAAAKFSRFIGSSAAGGAAAQAGGFATQGLLDRFFNRAKKEIPGAGAISGAANAIQPVIDPLGIKSKLKLALGAAGAAAAYIATRGIAQIAEIKDLSEQSGLATTAVQKLGNAAKQSGLDFSNFQTALAHGAHTRKEAAESSEALRKTYAALG